MQIVPLDRHPEFAETTADWIVHQWGSSRQSAEDALLDNQDCPPALVAMNAEGPMGILGYKVHLLQPNIVNELWINVLYVAPQFRGQGLGSRLVREAVKAAACLGRASLFAYTDIPAFYEALGWRRFSYKDETKMHVLECKLQPEPTAPHPREDT